MRGQTSLAVLGTVLAWTFSAGFSANGQTIKVEASGPHFARPGIIFRELRINYINHELSDAAQVRLNFGFRTRTQGAVKNPAVEFKPQGGPDYWCPSLIVRDWQSNKEIVLNRISDHTYSAQVTVNVLERGVPVHPSEFQFFVSIADGATLLTDRPPHDLGYYYVEIPAAESVSTGATSLTWSELPLMAREG